MRFQKSEDTNWSDNVKKTEKSPVVIRKIYFNTKTAKRLHQYLPFVSGERD